MIEELLTVISMHGQTAAQEIFHQLCDAIKKASLPWKKRFVGITTDGAPSVTRRNNGLVALVKKNKTGRGWRRGGHCSALHYPSAGPLQHMLEICDCDIVTKH